MDEEKEAKFGQELVDDGRLFQLVNAASSILSKQDTTKPIFSPCSSSNEEKEVSHLCKLLLDGQIEQHPTHNFLDAADDIEPSDKRYLLALHATDNQAVKQELKRKQLKEDSFKQTLRQERMVLHIQEMTRMIEAKKAAKKAAKSKRKKSATAGEDDEHDNNVVVDKKKSLPGDSSQISEQQMISMFQLEPNVLRQSIYEKFLVHYQYFYNQQLPTELLTKVMLPCTHPDVFRQNKLWAKIPFTSPEGQQSLIYANVQTDSYWGLDSFVPVFEKVLEVVPDSMLIYQQPVTIKNIPNFGTIVKAPFTYFGTHIFPNTASKPPANANNKPSLPSLTDGNDTSSDVEDKSVVDETTVDETDTSSVSSSSNSLSISSGPEAPKLRFVRVEVTGWNILQFDKDDRLILRVDNFLVNPMHESLYDVAPETMWDIAWKREKSILDMQQSH
jgi:hypothetical protein